MQFKTLLLLFLFTPVFSFAQTDELSSRLLIYGDLNLSINNNFVYKESLGGGGNFGIQYKIFKPFSIGIEYNNQTYKKFNDLNSLVKGYLTQLNGISLVGMLEFPLGRNWRIGFAGKYAVANFSGRVSSPILKLYLDANGLITNRLNEQVNIYTGLVQIKRHLFGIVAGQVGVSYNATTSYYLDMFNPNKQNNSDNFIALSAGLTLNIGKKGGKPRYKSKRIFCPKF